MILLSREDIAKNMRLFFIEKIWQEVQLYCRRIGKYCPYNEIENLNLNRYYSYLYVNEILIEKGKNNVIVIYKDKKGKIIKTCFIKLFNEMDYHEKVVNQTKIELNMI